MINEKIDRFIITFFSEKYLTAVKKIGSLDYELIARKMGKNLTKRGVYNLNFIQVLENKSDNKILSRETYHQFCAEISRQATKLCSEQLNYVYCFNASKYDDVYN